MKGYCAWNQQKRGSVGLGEWNGCCLCLCDVFFFNILFPNFHCLIVCWFDCLLVWLFVWMFGCLLCCLVVCILRSQHKFEPSTVRLKKKTAFHGKIHAVWGAPKVAIKWKVNPQKTKDVSWVLSNNTYTVYIYICISYGTIDRLCIFIQV